MDAPDNNGNATPSPEAGEGTPEAAMLDTVERLGSWRTGGRYTVSNAHRLTGISRSTLARWMRGYPDDVKALKPDWKDMSGNVRVQSDRLSFLELIEVIIASNIRVASGGSYEKVREHHSNLAAEWETLFPFAHKNMSGSARRTSIHRWPRCCSNWTTRTISRLCGAQWGKGKSLWSIHVVVRAHRR